MMENNLPTPKGSKVYSISLSNISKTLKGSQVYRNNWVKESSTPLGSKIPVFMFFYKPSIPSGLVNANERENDGK